MDEREGLTDDDRRKARESVLEDVKRAADAYSSARQELHEAFAEAKEAGASLREIGGAAGIAHETVRKALGRERARRTTRTGPVTRFGSFEMRSESEVPPTQESSGFRRIVVPLPPKAEEGSPPAAEEPPS